jgi:glycosyltransferase involved in cell wall biosynthesis
VTVPGAEAVSVIIPTHDRSRLVRRAVDSVLAQSVPPAEVLVVDDCSQDDTLAVLADYGERVRVLAATTNIERAAARNWGARESSSPVLAFLDSDDEWEPTKLEAQLPRLAGRPAAAWVTGLRYIDDAGLLTGRTYVPPRDGVDRLVLENPFLGSPSSLLLRRETFDAVGGFPEDRVVQGSEDWIFLNLLRAQGTELGALEEPLVRYRIHGSNDTGDPRQVERSMWAAVGWMADHGLVGGAGEQRLRARTAGVIARGHAAKGGWGPAARWARRSMGVGAPLEGMRAVALAGATACHTKVVGRHR